MINTISSSVKVPMTEDRIIYMAKPRNTANKKSKEREVSIMVKMRNIVLGKSVFTRIKISIFILVVFCVIQKVVSAPITIAQVKAPLAPIRPKNDVKPIAKEK